MGRCVRHVSTPSVAAWEPARISLMEGLTVSLPYSYSCDMLPADAEDLLEAALGAAHVVRRKHGTVYRVNSALPSSEHNSVLIWSSFYMLNQTGSLCSTLYPAPGNILDWMYASAGVKYSYAVHLRDLGTVRLSSLSSIFSRTSFLSRPSFSLCLYPTSFVMLSFTFLYTL